MSQGSGVVALVLETQIPKTVGRATTAEGKGATGIAMYAAAVVAFVVTVVAVVVDVVKRSVKDVVKRSVKVIPIITKDHQQQ